MLQSATKQLMRAPAARFPQPQAPKMTPGHHLPQGHEVFGEPAEHAAVPAVHITLEVSHVKSSRASLTSLIFLLPREAPGLLPTFGRASPLPKQKARLLQQMERPQPRQSSPWSPLRSPAHHSLDLVLLPSPDVVFLLLIILAQMMSAAEVCRGSCRLILSSRLAPKKETKGRKRQKRKRSLQ